MGRKARQGSEYSGLEEEEAPIPRGGNSPIDHGVVNRINREKGFGFIREQATGVDYFFHYTELQNCTLEDLREGDTVSFLPAKTPKGLRANTVIRTGEGRTV